MKQTSPLVVIGKQIAINSVLAQVPSLFDSDVRTCSEVYGTQNDPQVILRFNITPVVVHLPKDSPNFGLLFFKLRLRMLGNPVLAALAQTDFGLNSPGHVAVRDGVTLCTLDTNSISIPNRS